jgi:hypothetical protein
MRQAGRAAPFLWPGRNALRRRWDRIESAVVIGLAALFLIAGPAGPPADGRLDVSLAAASGALGLGCVLFLAGAGARVLLDRRRMAGWETAWRAVGPQWSRRR